MKKNPTLSHVPPEPSEESIRDYAFYLYEQSNCAANRDLENWFEATAYLKARISAEDSGRLSTPAIVGALDS